MGVRLPVDSTLGVVVAEGGASSRSLVIGVLESKLAELEYGPRWMRVHRFWRMTP